MPEKPQTIAEQYDIGALGQDVEEAPAPVVETPARGPDGKFLPKETIHTHPSYQARRAKDLGMSDAEIAATSPEVLDHIIYQATEQWRLNAMQRDVDRRPQETVQPEPSEPAFAIDDEASIHPGLLKLMKDQQKTIAEMQKKLESVQNEGRARYQETVEERVDRIFAESPEIFGVGSGSEMDKTSAQFKARKRVLGAADQVKGGTVERKIRTAIAEMKELATLFGAAKPEATPAKPAESELTPAQIAWNEGATARPTARKSSLDSMVNGRDKAIRAVRAEMQGQAVNGEVSETTLDEFPG